MQRFGLGPLQLKAGDSLGPRGPRVAFQLGLGQIFSRQLRRRVHGLQSLLIQLRRGLAVASLFELLAILLLGNRVAGLLERRARLAQCVGVLAQRLRPGTEVDEPAVEFGQQLDHLLIAALRLAIPVVQLVEFGAGSPHHCLALLAARQHTDFGIKAGVDRGSREIICEVRLFKRLALLDPQRPPHADVLGLGALLAGSAETEQPLQLLLRRIAVETASIGREERGHRLVDEALLDPPTAVADVELHCEPRCRVAAARLHLPDRLGTAVVALEHQAANRREDG